MIILSVNKVVYNNETLIDLTTDTVTPEYLLWKQTAHQANGSKIDGLLLENWPDTQLFHDTLDDSDGNKIVDSEENEINGAIIYKRL